MEVRRLWTIGFDERSSHRRMGQELLDVRPSCLEFHRKRHCPSRDSVAGLRRTVCSNDRRWNDSFRVGGSTTENLLPPIISGSLRLDHHSSIPIYSAQV